MTDGHETTTATTRRRTPVDFYDLLLGKQLEPSKEYVINLYTVHKIQTTDNDSKNVIQHVHCHLHTQILATQ